MPSSVVHCLNGNLLASLIRLGRRDDPCVQQAVAWQACAITGEEPIRYDQSGTSGPAFACAINAGQPCAWGATKAMKALAAVPPAQRTSLIQQAIEQGVQLLLRYHLASADYPFTGPASRGRTFAALDAPAPCRSCGPARGSRPWQADCHWRRSPG